MTVQELINKLEDMPRDAVVIYSCFSEYEAMRDEEPVLVTAEDKTVVLRAGRYIDYRENQWSVNEKPQFVTVVKFPGN